MGFDAFDLKPELLARLEQLGMRDPRPIQARAIPVALAGQDLIGKAETGTGKTLAFALPILHHIETARVAIQAMVLAPTRELAQQVADVFQDLGAGSGLNVALIVGGVRMKEQLTQLARGCQVVVGTPGRVLDLLQNRYLQVGWVGHLVLDEGDQMLDMGFIDDIDKILSFLPRDRQTMMFSATFPEPLARLARSHMTRPQTISTAQGLATVDTIEQTYCRVDLRHKRRLLRQILERDPKNCYLVFCNTRKEVRLLEREFWGRGYNVAAIHGDLSQDLRFKILAAYRAGQVQALIATDVAARGLDIEHIDHVINYEVPRDAETYTHRIGRTGRAGRSGVVITLVSPVEARDFERIRKLTGFPFAESQLSPDSHDDGGGGRRRSPHAKRTPRRSGRLPIQAAPVEQAPAPPAATPRWAEGRRRRRRPHGVRDSARRAEPPTGGSSPT